MAAQSRAMLNREGKAHFQLQQSIEAVANELIRACDEENHREFVENALTAWTASVEAQLKEQAQRARQ
eukprot:12928253-Prorocentrum_lima.AAC.1